MIILRCWNVYNDISSADYTCNENLDNYSMPDYSSLSSQVKFIIRLAGFSKSEKSAVLPNFIHFPITFWFLAKSESVSLTLCYLKSNEQKSTTIILVGIVFL